jgi:hypothetical protein
MHALWSARTHTLYRAASLLAPAVTTLIVAFLNNAHCCIPQQRSLLHPQQRSLLHSSLTLIVASLYIEPQVCWHPQSSKITNPPPPPRTPSTSASPQTAAPADGRIPGPKRPKESSKTKAPYVGYEEEDICTLCTLWTLCRLCMLGPCVGYEEEDSCTLCTLWTLCRLWRLCIVASQKCVASSSSYACILLLIGSLQQLQRQKCVACILHLICMYPPPLCSVASLLALANWLCW